MTRGRPGIRRGRRNIPRINQGIFAHPFFDSCQRAQRIGVYAWLATHEPIQITIRELAEEMRLTKAKTNRILEQLDEAGLIQWERTRGVWGWPGRIRVLPTNKVRRKTKNAFRNEVLLRDNYRCTYCGSKENLEIDHIVPISDGGPTTLDNLVTACMRCNISKGNRTLADWLNTRWPQRANGHPPTSPLPEVSSTIRFLPTEDGPIADEKRGNG